MPANESDSHRILVVVLLLAALGLRIALAADAPFDFAVMRQHHSALIARSLYLESRSDAPAAQRASSADYLAHATRPEPLVMERLAAWGYALAGGEDLRIPRTLSAVFWVAGALFLFAGARRLAGPSAAAIAAAVYLFLPYTFRASVSIQPDPLSVMWLCAGVYGLTRLLECWTLDRIVVAALMAMPAVFLRPLTVCFLYPVFCLLAFSHRRDGVAVWLNAVAYFVISAGPAALFVAHGLVIGNAMAGRFAATFVPSLLIEPAFWRGWARNAWLAFGPVVFGGAFLALLLSAGGMRVVLSGLWIGYALYGLTFNLHVSTHPYYQTLAVPFVALSLSALGPAVDRMFSTRRVWAGQLVAIGLVAVFLVQGYRNGVFSNADDSGVIADSRAIGEAVGHSRRVVFLAPDWGAPLRYYGEFSGRYWPTRFEVGMYRPLGASGIPDSAAEARLASLSREMGGAEFFVATDLHELNQQSDLRDLLDGRYRVRGRTPRYVIYELGR